MAVAAGSLIEAGTFRSALGAALIAVIVGGCTARLPTGPPLPSPVVLNVTYLQNTDHVPPATDPGCPHHNAPLNLTLTTSWGASLRLQPAGERRYLGVVTSEPGTHWMRLIDIAWCGSEFGALASMGLAVNGIELTRFIAVDDGERAFEFAVGVRGEIEP